MEKKLMLPANYNVMNEEEMTYTSGAAATVLPLRLLWVGRSAQSFLLQT